MRYLLMAVLTVFVMSAAALAGEKITLDKLPKPVADAVAKRFPKAEAKSASKGGTDGKVVYEVTLKEGGKNIDVSLTDAGAITQIEKELAFADLPKAVAATFEKKYPKAAYTIIEAVITVKDGKETLDYYEAALVTADKKTFDAEVLPDGKFKSETEKTPKKDGKPNQCGDDDEKGAKNAKNKNEDEKGGKNEKGKGEGDKKGVELPKAVAESVKSKFPGSTVTGVQKGGKGEDTVYEVALRQKAGALAVTMTPKGQVTKVEVKGASDEKGNGKKEEGEDDKKGKGKKGEDDDKNEKGQKKGEDDKKDGKSKGKKGEDDKKGEKSGQSGFQGEQKGQNEDKDDKKGEDKKKGKKKGEDDKNEKNEKGQKGDM